MFVFIPSFFIQMPPVTNGPLVVLIFLSSNIMRRFFVYSALTKFLFSIFLAVAELLDNALDEVIIPVY